MGGGSMNIPGISCHCHDAAAAPVRDMAEQERLPEWLAGLTVGNRRRKDGAVVQSIHRLDRTMSNVDGARMHGVRL